MPYSPLPREMPGLDGLRGLAALIVLVSHSAESGLLPEILGGGFGQAGVGIFYSLSGFLMAHVTFHKPFNLTTGRSYLRDRASRVLPLFYCIVLANSALFFAFDEAFYDINSLGDIAGNVFLYKGTSVLWSIPVEIMFYVIFLAIWMGYERNLFWPVMIGLTALQLVMIPYLEDDRAIPFWLHFFLIGVILRYLLDTGKRNILPATVGRRMVVAGWLGLIALLLLPLQVRVALGYATLPSYADPYVILLTPVLIWLSLTRTGPFRIFAQPVLRWYGKISFSLYLLHPVVLALVRRFDLYYGFAGFVGVLIVTSIISILSFELIEKPAQTYLRSGARPRLLQRRAW